jgi:hypothetical protein
LAAPAAEHEQMAVVGIALERLAVASASRKKPKVLPPAPHPDDMAEPPDPEPAVTGPCQVWTRSWKNTRAAKAAGALVVVEDEPYVSEREKKLKAGREYHRKHYKSKKGRKGHPC